MEERRTRVSDVLPEKTSVAAPWCGAGANVTGRVRRRTVTVRLQTSTPKFCVLGSESETCMHAYLPASAILVHARANYAQRSLHWIEKNTRAVPK